MIDPDTIEDPPGYCRIEGIPRTLERNASSDTPWRVRRGPAAREFFSPIKKVTLDDDAFDMRFANRAKQHELLALVERGLVDGTLRSVGLLFDVLRPDGCLVQLTPAHWRIPQSSAYAPLDGAKAPFEWAVSVQMIRLLPELEASPVVLPLVSEVDLAIFLGAEHPPSAADLPIMAWREWRLEFRAEMTSGRKPRTPQGGRPTNPVQNKAMWHEVVRRAMAGQLAGKTLQEVTQEIHEFMSVQFVDPQDETTVRRQLEGLFPTNSEAQRVTGRGL